MDDARPWIAYVGQFDFPWGQAASRRVYGVARSLTAAGFEVVVVTEGGVATEPVVLAEDVHLSAVRVGGQFATRFGRIGRALLALFVVGAATRAWLAGRSTLPAAVVVYGGRAPYLFFLRRWAKTNGVPLVADVVERYEPAHLRGGGLGPLRWASELEHRILHRRLAGAIVISEYLETHYRSQGLATVRVPPTFDRAVVGSPEIERKSAGLVTVAYCGSPGKKDALPLIVAAAAEVPGVRLTIAGPSAEDLLAMCGQIPANVVALGRVPQEAVWRIVRESDFTIVVRQETRSAAAGFPTKVVESLAVGTPVIANITSDLGAYLIDGSSAVVVSEPDLDGVVTAMRRVESMTSPELTEMRRHAAQVGEAFEWTAHVAPLRAFVEGVRP